MCQLSDENPLNHYPSLRSGMEHQIFWITKRIAQGQFATPERAKLLREQDVSHVLNVGESSSIISAEKSGFCEVRDCPIVDLQRIPDGIAITAMDSLHEMLAGRVSRVYIHCIAGQNRSPTILWLYLIACGVSPEDARKLIASRSPDSVPGHGLLIDDSLVEIAILHGMENYLPLSDPSVLDPAY